MSALKTWGRTTRPRSVFGGTLRTRCSDPQCPWMRAPGGKTILSCMAYGKLGDLGKPRPHDACSQGSHLVRTSAGAAGCWPVPLPDGAAPDRLWTRVGSEHFEVELLGDFMTDTAAPILPKKRRRRLLVAILVSVLVIGGGTTGGLAWTEAEKNRQTLARAEEAKRVENEAAAKKKAASDAFWAKTYADEQKRKTAEAQKDAEKAAASRAAAAADVASKGWTEKAAGIYMADIPNATCSYSACSRFLVMTTLTGGCPNGIVIRGRWLKGDLKGDTVTGPVTEITGPVKANEQAAVEANDYTGYADSIDLTDFSCR